MYSQVEGIVIKITIANTNLIYTYYTLRLFTTEKGDYDNVNYMICKFRDKYEKWGLEMSLQKTRFPNIYKKVYRQKNI